jgi:methylated-DNA-[protein]-cysteine S-methyltransferase
MSTLQLRRDLRGRRAPPTRIDATTITATAFPTDLGWMALVMRGDAVVQLIFGQASPQAALAALDRTLLMSASIDSPPRPSTVIGRLAKRLQAYAAGASDDFLDVQLDAGPMTDFQQAVVKQCRRIPVGRTLSYGDLAMQARAPRAARAVGNVMATNRVPIIVPCHRVVASGGHLGGYSMGDGLSVKIRLLKLEAGMLAPARQKAK